MKLYVTTLLSPDRSDLVVDQRISDSAEHNAEVILEAFNKETLYEDKYTYEDIQEDGFQWDEREYDFAISPGPL